MKSFDPRYWQDETETEIAFKRFCRHTANTHCMGHVEVFKYDIVVAIQVLTAQKIEQLKVELLSEVEEPYRKVNFHHIFHSFVAILFLLTANG